MGWLRELLTFYHQFTPTSIIILLNNIDPDLNLLDPFYFMFLSCAGLRLETGPAYCCSSGGQSNEQRLTEDGSVALPENLHPPQ